MSNIGQQRDQAAIQKTTTEARQGSTPGMGRNVLVWGVALVVVAFAILWLVYYV